MCNAFIRTHAYACTRDNTYTHNGARCPNSFSRVHSAGGGGQHRSSRRRCTAAPHQDLPLPHQPPCDTPLTTSPSLLAGDRHCPGSAALGIKHRDPAHCSVVPTISYLNRTMPWVYCSPRSIRQHSVLPLNKTFNQ